MLVKAQCILVVDHNAVLRSVLAEIFREYGWVVRTAQDGFSALAEFREQVPDLLLSDLNLDGMSGDELLSVVRRRFPEVRVIAMSSECLGNVNPRHVPADAFYSKGESSVAKLLQMVAEVAEQPGVSKERRSSPIWLSAAHLPLAHEGVVVVHCPQCLRPFCYSPTEETENLEQVTGRCHCRHDVRIAVLSGTERNDPSPIARPTSGRDRHQQSAEDHCAAGVRTPEASIL